MLILTRRIGEVVRIGDDVSITVLGVKGNQVRLGVAAPRSVAVHREEIFQRIARESQAEAEPPEAFEPGIKDRVNCVEARRKSTKSKPNALSTAAGRVIRAQRQR